MFDTSPLSEEVDRELVKQFSSFHSIDELVQKQEELYNQIIQYQQIHKFQNHQHQRSQAYQDNQDNKIKLNASDQKKTRNQVQSNSFKNPFPNTIPSIIYENQSNSSFNQDSKLSLKAQQLLNSLSSSDPAFAYQQSSTIKNDLNYQNKQTMSINSTVNHDYQQNLYNGKNGHQSSLSSSSLISSKPQQVTERLLTIGKIYDAKKQKLKQEYEHKKKSEEDQIVKQIKRKYSKENFNYQQIEGGTTNQQPVEKRLNELKKKYSQNALQRQKERMIEELSEVKNPQINQKSEQLVQKKQEFKMKVEDRLINIGHMWKEKKEIQQKEYFDEIDNRAYPVITTMSNKCETEKTPKKPQLNQPSTKNFEARLKENMDKKEIMITELKKKYEKEQHQIMSFNPSLKSLDKKQIDEAQNEFQQRQKSFVENKKQKQEKITSQEHSKWTFAPQINENSKKMIQSTSKERMQAVTPKRNNHTRCKQDKFSKSPNISRRNSNDYGSSSLNHSQQRYKSKTPRPEKASPKFTFKPVINQNSIRMLQNNSENEQQPRWEKLYERHIQQRQLKEEVIRKIEEDNLKQLEEECTFKPELGESSKAFIYQNVNGAGQLNQVYERSQAWHQNKEQSIANTFFLHQFTLIELQNLNEQIRKEELDECTFHPQIVKIFNITSLQDKNQLDEVIQADYSQLNTKAIERFLERCNYAKQLKLEQELKEMRINCSGSKWKNKITKPQAPSFMHSYYEDIKEVRSRSQSPLKKEKPVQKLSSGSKKELSDKKVAKAISNSESDSEQFMRNDYSDKLLYTIQETDTQQEQSKNTTQIYTDQFLQQQTLVQQQQQHQNPQQQDQMSPRFDQANSSNNPSHSQSNSQISDTIKQQYSMAESEKDGVEFHSAMLFLHEQLHKIDFSFDQ